MGVEAEQTTPTESPIDQLQKLSTTNRLAEMEANLSNSEYIVLDMALSGQVTLFFAAPNTGKTLLMIWFLIDAFKRGVINPADVFYINADDHYAGVVQKTRIAKQYGFHMISPAEAHLTPKDILELLEQMALSSEAKGKVFILDTLKKFADMMNKNSQANLYETLRRLVAQNATVILLGHTNKHADADGNLIYEGTSDTLNDVDCAYAIYRMREKHSDEMVVEFRNEKDRGSVVRKVSYGYQQAEGMTYQERLDSIYRLSDSDAKAAAKQAKVEQTKERFESEILFIRDALKDGPLNQSQVLSRYTKADGEGLASEVSKNSLKQCLDALQGIEWEVARDRIGNNAKKFSLKNGTSYQRAKWGEHDF